MSAETKTYTVSLDVDTDADGQITIEPNRKAISLKMDEATELIATGDGYVSYDGREWAVHDSTDDEVTLVEASRVPITLRLSNGLLQRIDAERGDVPRNKWITRRLAEATVTIDGKEVDIA